MGKENLFKVKSFKDIDIKELKRDYKDLFKKHSELKDEFNDYKDLVIHVSKMTALLIDELESVKKAYQSDLNKMIAKVSYLESKMLPSYIYKDTLNTVTDYKPTELLKDDWSVVLNETKKLSVSCAVLLSKSTLKSIDKIKKEVTITFKEKSMADLLRASKFKYIEDVLFNIYKENFKLVIEVD